MKNRVLLAFLSYGLRFFTAQHVFFLLCYCLRLSNLSMRHYQLVNEFDLSHAINIFYFWMDYRILRTNSSKKTKEFSQQSMLGMPSKEKWEITNKQYRYVCYAINQLNRYQLWKLLNWKWKSKSKNKNCDSNDIFSPQHGSFNANSNVSQKTFFF